MEYCPSCFSSNLPLPLFTMVKPTHGVFLRHWRPIDHWITLQCFGYPVSIIFKYATWSLLVLTKYYYYVITLWGQTVYAVLHSQIGLRDAGGLLSCITAASCSALLSNSLSCLIIAADKHMCTGTAPPTWTLFSFFSFTLPVICTSVENMQQCTVFICLSFSSSVLLFHPIPTNYHILSKLHITKTNAYNPSDISKPQWPCFSSERLYSWAVFPIFHHFYQNLYYDLLLWMPSISQSFPTFLKLFFFLHPLQWITLV